VGLVVGIVGRKCPRFLSLITLWLVSLGLWAEEVAEQVSLEPGLHLIHPGLQRHLEQGAILLCSGERMALMIRCSSGRIRDFYSITPIVLSMPRNTVNPEWALIRSWEIANAKRNPGISLSRYTYTYTLISLSPLLQDALRVVEGTHFLAWSHSGVGYLSQVPGPNLIIQIRSLEFVVQTLEVWSDAWYLFISVVD